MPSELPKRQCVRVFDFLFFFMFVVIAPSWNFNSARTKPPSPHIPKGTSLPLPPHTQTDQTWHYFLPAHNFPATRPLVISPFPHRVPCSTFTPSDAPVNEQGAVEGTKTHTNARNLRITREFHPEAENVGGGARGDESLRPRHSIPRTFSVGSEPRRRRASHPVIGLVNNRVAS